MEDKKKKPPTNNIGKMQDNLYSQGFENDTTSRSEFTHPNLVVNKAWQERQMNPKTGEPVSPKPIAGSVVKKIFIISIIFFVICAGAAAFVFYGGLNVLSSNNVDMAFVGPVAVAAGNELDFDVVVQNQNTSTITNAELYVDYPDGTKQAVDLTQDLLHEKDTLGDIQSHSDVKHTVRSVLFGKQNSLKEIVVTLEYGLNNSNAVYKKQKTYQVNISSTPLTMTVTHPTESPSGQDVAFSVDVVSNSNVPLTNLLLRLDYPLGFKFTTSNPVVTADNNVWSIPVLKPGETKTIVINGVADGQEGDEKVFRFNVGIASGVNPNLIATSFLASTESVLVHRPPLATKFIVNDVPGVTTHTIDPGGQIKGVVTLTNNTSFVLLNGQAQVAIIGPALDPTSPNADGAVYHLPIQTINWDRTTLPALGELAPGQSTDLNFIMSSLPQDAIRGLKNGQIDLIFTASTTATGAGQTIKTSAQQSVKILPQLTFIPRLVYSTGPFKNTGPMPPRPEMKTTYTAIWTITHSSDDIVGAEVHANLPSYVKWLGVISPTTENLTWNPDKNEVVWRVGDIPAGIDGQSAKEVAFQVQLTPGYNQVKTSPDVVNNIIFKATDSFVNFNFLQQNLKLTTFLQTDPKYGDSAAKVSN